MYRINDMVLQKIIIREKRFGVLSEKICARRFVNIKSKGEISTSRSLMRPHYMPNIRRIQIIIQQHLSLARNLSIFILMFKISQKYLMYSQMKNTTVQTSISISSSRN